MRNVKLKNLSSFVLALVIAASFLCVTVMAEEKLVAKKYNFSEGIESYSKTNADVQGWVYVGGTNINYPIVFYPQNTFYYNSLGYDKKSSTNGVIWADGMTQGGSEDEISTNTVLYGHNWTNVSSNPRIAAPKDVMFAQLAAFHHLDFAKNNQFINYATSEESYVYQVFAVFYTEVGFVYNRSEPTAEQYKEILSGARARSLHNFDVEVSTSDKIITLSTCTRAFGPSANQRFVVMGKLVSSGTEAVGVTANANYQRPKL